MCALLLLFDTFAVAMSMCVTHLLGIPEEQTPRGSLATGSEWQTDISLGDPISHWGGDRRHRTRCAGFAAGLVCFLAEWCIWNCGAGCGPLPWTSRVFITSYHRRHTREIATKDTSSTATGGREFPHRRHPAQTRLVPEASVSDQRFSLENMASRAPNSDVERRDAKRAGFRPMH